MPVFKLCKYLNRNQFCASETLHFRITREKNRKKSPPCDVESVQWPSVWLRGKTTKNFPISVETRIFSPGLVVCGFEWLKALLESGKILIEYLIKKQCGLFMPRCSSESSLLRCENMDGTFIALVDRYSWDESSAKRDRRHLLSMIADEVVTAKNTVSFKYSTTAP